MRLVPSKNESAALIVGPKGAGKTTTLLELVCKFDFEFMSGDKTFIWVEDGKFMAAGWPDYPHLGIGTLFKYPKLMEKLQLSDPSELSQGDMWSTKEKIVVDPRVFREIIPHTAQGTVCPVGSFIYPYLYPSDTCNIVPMEDHANLMAEHIERVFEVGIRQWNQFVQPKNMKSPVKTVQLCIDSARKIPAYQITGSGYLDDISILTSHEKR
jgi:hypothetical protein